MAYTPTAADFQEVAPSYVPSLSDFQEAMPQPMFGNSTPGLFAAHTLADVATSGTDLANTLKGVVNNYLPAKTPQPIQNFFAPDTTNYYNALGINPNMVDKYAVAAGDIAPYFTGAGEATRALAIPGEVAPIVSQNMLAFMGQDAANDPSNPAQGALSGVIPGALSSVLGVGAMAAPRVAADIYGRTAFPGLISKGTDMLQSGLGNATDYAAQLAGKFQQAKDINNNAWNAVTEHAANLDTQLQNNGQNFDATPYTQHISDFLNKVGSMEPATARKYQNAVGFAQEEAQNLTPQSFQGAVDLRQNLNNFLQDYANKKQLDLNDKQTSNFIQSTKNVLNNDVIDANKDAVNPDDLENFKNAWENANQTHQAQLSFANTTNAAGAPVFSNVLNKAGQAQSPEGAILNEFMPTPAQTGTNEIQHLGNLMGDQQTANNALLSYALRNANSKGAADKAVTNFYQKLSPEQRNALVGNSEAQPYLQTASNAITRYGMPIAPSWGWSPVSHFGLHYGIPGALGLGAGMALNLPLEQAGALGAGSALAARGLGYLAQKTATPQSVNAAMNLAKKPLQGNLAGKYLPPGLVQQFLPAYPQNALANPQGDQ
jgi:hypothetical protein